MQIQHPALTDLQGIAHGFFTRNGGTSSDPYSSLNCGYGSDDDRDQVRRNRGLVAQALGVKADHLLTANQVHSPDVVIVETPFAEADKPRVDALVTSTPGLAVSILTADCGPLLFADPTARVVAAAHAGWRGAFDGVIEATIEAMLDKGADRTNITAILGPTISERNYEVDDLFMERFVERDESWSRFFNAGKRDGHMQFDLPAFILARLNATGIGTAINLDRCTYGEEDSFFSYRRSTHKDEPDYGRQISAIVLA